MESSLIYKTLTDLIKRMERIEARLKDLPITALQKRREKLQEKLVSRKVLAKLICEHIAHYYKKELLPIPRYSLSRKFYRRCEALPGGVSVLLDELINEGKLCIIKTLNDATLLLTYDQMVERSIEEIHLFEEIGVKKSRVDNLREKQKQALGIKAKIAMEDEPNEQKESISDILEKLRENDPESNT